MYTLLVVVEFIDDVFCVGSGEEPLDVCSPRGSACVKGTNKGTPGEELSA